MSKKNEDPLTNKIRVLVNGSPDPLETMEIVGLLGDTAATRTKVARRLILLWGQRQIKGKQLKAGKGNWIWWSV